MVYSIGARMISSSPLMLEADSLIAPDGCGVLFINVQFHLMKVQWTKGSFQQQPDCFAGISLVPVFLSAYDNTQDGVPVSRVD